MRGAWWKIGGLILSLYLLMAALVLQAALSWFNPYSHVASLLAAVTRPFLMPLRRRIPPVGNVDLTVLVLLIACQLILIVPLRWLETAAQRLL